MWDVLIFAGVAIFLIFKLGSVLGKRTGKERPPSDVFRPAETQGDGNVVSLPGRQDKPSVDAPAAQHDDTPLGRGLAAISAADPDFDGEQFLEGARGAFEMVLNAFASGDGKTLKMLLSDEVYQSFAAAIREREKAGEKLEETLVGIDEARLVEARMDGRTAYVAVEFRSKQITALVDADGKVIEGDPNAIVDVVDIWTFARDTRDRDPNWALVETRSPE